MRTTLVIGTMSAALVGQAALGVGTTRVNNFMLLDHRGDAHELYYYSDAPAIVLIVQGNGCPIVRNALTDYRQVSDEYLSKGVPFLMLNANLQDGRHTIAAEADEWDIPYPILVDETQLVAESLGLTPNRGGVGDRPGRLAGRLSGAHERSPELRAAEAIGVRALRARRFGCAHRRYGRRGRRQGRHGLPDQPPRRASGSQFRLVTAKPSPRSLRRTASHAISPTASRLGR